MPDHAKNNPKHMPPENYLSLDATLEGAVRSLKTRFPDISGTHLDIGSGTGSLILRIQQEYDVSSCGCDYTDEFMAADHISVNVVDLNDGKLPYADSQFDLVTFTEVAEHLENYRAIIREIYRVLKPGGVIAITTPNVLNMKSRMRFMSVGFWSMFGPLHVGERAIESAGGHITPVPWPYLAHAMMTSGFDQLQCDIDKYQFPSMYWLVLFYLPIRLTSWMIWKKEQRKYQTMDEHNEPMIRQINSLNMLLGRSIVVTAHKPQ